MTIAFIDLETYSPTPITHGTHRYAEKAEVLLFAFALDDEPPQVWDCTQQDEPPADLVRAINDPDILVYAHQAAFDRTILRHALPHLCPALERWRCTMVMALEHSLPASLAQLCAVLKVPTDLAKDAAGKKLIRLFCQPRPKNVKLRRATAETHPIQWAEFVSYAASDILAMREIVKRIPDWNFVGNEIDLWHLDQRINDRGVLADIDLAKAALRATTREQDRLADRARHITDGAVAAATQRDALLRHIQTEYGIELPDLQKATVEKLLDSGTLPLPVHELLSVRLAASSTSVAKYAKVLDCASSDGRIRGTLQFCGASRTFRFGGRLIQPQNFPRPRMKAWEIESGIEALKADCEDLIVDDVTELLSSALRGIFIAPPGKKLVVADLSAIEGRVLAWLAGEEWKIKAFAEGADLYKVAYSKCFGISPEEVNPDQRQIGKTMELAMGYQGSIGAFHTFATAFAIDLEEMAVNALPFIPTDVYADSEGMYDWAMKKGLPDYGLSKRAWSVCDSFKALWRQAHPMTVKLWRDMEDTFKTACINRGKDHITDQGLVFRRSGNWLRIQKPSGQSLVYPAPQIDPKLSYMGTNQFTRKWERIDTYGGRLVENSVQSISRDILCHGMQLAESAGYEVVLHVHDELICETPDTDRFSAEGLAYLMSSGPSWATGLPLAAEGFTAYRYKK